MANEKKCPECGNLNIKEAGFDANSKLYPIDTIFKPGRGSMVVADVCTKCGLVLGLRVLKPDKFK